MNTYTLYWIDGQRETVTGESVARAMARAGYGRGALEALDFYVKGESHDYEWDPKERDWVHKVDSALRLAAEEAYASEVEQSGMEDIIIGEGKDFKDKEEWIKERVEEWLRGG